MIDDTGFPKFGKRSVGVARQYSGALGKVGNCQIGVSINAAAEDASCPLNWRLFIPEEWDEHGRVEPEAAQEARLPEDVHHVEKWRQALEMIDELIGWGLTPPVILGDGAYGDTTELRTGLEQRGLDYVLDVKSATSAYPRGGRARAAGATPGPRTAAERPLPPGSLIAQELALAAGKKAASTVTWREGTRGKMSSRFLALRVRPANIDLRRQAHKNGERATGPLAAVRVAGQSRRTDQVLALEPARPTHRSNSSCGSAKMRFRIEQDYRELKDALGLDHFEGRSYPGWNHHVTLVSVAHAFLTLERRRRPPARAAA